MPDLPDTRHLRELLTPWVGKRAYVVPITDRNGQAYGNNGDQLMLEVFERLLVEFNITCTANKSVADVIIVPPSGALLEVYAFPKILAERLRGSQDVPLVVFPSSALFPAIDPAFMFAGRSAPTLWILREPHSFHHLREKWRHSLTSAGVTLALDHDVVASGHEHVPKILHGEICSRHMLVASRIDGEAHDMAAGWASPVAARNSAKRALAMMVRKAVPYGRMRTYLGRLARRKESAVLGARMVATLPPQILEQCARDGVSVVSVDVSLPGLATFDEYSRLIREAAVVITNRLHVALPATILGKRVFLVDSGYHKLRGVYEHSLNRMDNIQFLAALGTR